MPRFKITSRLLVCLDPSMILRHSARCPSGLSYGSPVVGVAHRQAVIDLLIFGSGLGTLYFSRGTQLLHMRVRQLA